MKVVVISDTHRGHEELGSLSGDVLIHCGDIGMGGDTTFGEVQRLDAWFSKQAFRLILCTGGNHDFALEEAARRQAPLFSHATYLEDRAVEFEGVRFYGAPWVPELRGWAYFKDTPSLVHKWSLIPEDTDVLITHTPPYGILDRSSTGRSCGCHDLRARTRELRLRLHCFGHIHASAGMLREGGTTFVNASMVDRRYKIARTPYELTL